MDIKLDYVFREVMPSGNVRYRFRRNGVKVTLKGAPGSKEFLQHYTSLLDGPSFVTPERVAEGSVAWLVGKYLADLQARSEVGIASPLTLKGHRHHLAKLVAEYGDRDANMPRGKLMLLRDKFTATPGAADNLLKAVSALYKWAIKRDMVSVPNPTRDVDRLNRGSEGFEPWDADDFRRYFEFHQSGTMARRAAILAIATTARRGDVVRLGRQHEFIRNGRKWLRWKQDKAPHRVVELPMLKMLIREVEGHPDMTYLLTGYGSPFSSAGFGNKFRAWCDAAKIGKSLHGIRKGVSCLLPSHGVSSLELDVLLGHEMNSEETKVYVADAARAALAESVVDRLDALAW